jgi:hypothetical protein
MKLVGIYIKYCYLFLAVLYIKKEEQEEFSRSTCAGGFAALILTRHILKMKMDSKAVRTEQVVRLLFLMPTCVTLSS